MRRPTSLPALTRAASVLLPVTAAFAGAAGSLSPLRATFEERPYLRGSDLDVVPAAEGWILRGRVPTALHREAALRIARGRLGSSVRNEVRIDPTLRVPERGADELRLARIQNARAAIAHDEVLEHAPLELVATPEAIVVVGVVPEGAHARRAKRIVAENVGEDERVSLALALVPGAGGCQDTCGKGATEPAARAQRALADEPELIRRAPDVKAVALGDGVALEGEVPDLLVHDLVLEVARSVFEEPKPKVRARVDARERIYGTARPEPPREPAPLLRVVSHLKIAGVAPEARAEEPREERRDEGPGAPPEPPAVPPHHYEKDSPYYREGDSDRSRAGGVGFDDSTALERDLRRELDRRACLRRLPILVTVERGRATLAGRVPDAVTRALAEQLIANDRRVRGVRDDLVVDTGVPRFTPTADEREEIDAHNARIARGRVDPVGRPEERLPLGPLVARVRSHPALTTLVLEAREREGRIVLSGQAPDLASHDLALELAVRYARALDASFDRERIEDRIAIR